MADLLEVTAQHISQLRLQDAAAKGPGAVQQHTEATTNKMFESSKRRQSVWDSDATKFAADRKAYLDKVNAGRNFAKVNPLAPEFSQQAEEERQLHKLGLKPMFGPPSIAFVEHQKREQDRMFADAKKRQSVWDNPFEGGVKSPVGKIIGAGIEGVKRLTSSVQEFLKSPPVAPESITPKTLPKPGYNIDENQQLRQLEKEGN